MQRAARDVAVQNSRLKALLAKKGVSADEVDAYLKSFGDGAGDNALAAIAAMPNSTAGASSTATPVTPAFDTASTASPVDPTSSTSIGATPTPAPIPGKVLLQPAPSSKSRSCSGRVLSPTHAGIRREPPLKDHASRMSLTNLMNGDDLPPIQLRPASAAIRSMDKWSALADTGNSQTGHGECCDGLTQCSGMSQKSESLPSRSSIESAEAYAESSSCTARNAGNRSSSEASVDASPHEMSCNAAAQIIVSIHDQVDRNAARSALGCKDSGDCTVRNTKLFQILEDPSRLGS